jgi:eukaryotic translation initiation factor 2C
MMINIDFHATAFYESRSLTRIVKKVLNKRTIEELRNFFKEFKNLCHS